MRDLESRTDIKDLLSAFYDELRQDEMLGDIFNTHVPLDAWPHHLERITDFWEDVLFKTHNYSGNIKEVHVQLNRKVHSGLSPEHFGRWMEHWVASINSRFEGPRAELLVSRARNMSTALLLAVYN